MDRITCVQLYVNRLLDTITDSEEHRTAAVHLYGVAGNAALLAIRRSLDPELATVAGLLHDISTYATGERQQRELYYIGRISLWLDIKIVFMTVQRVFSGKGAV